MFEEKDEVTEAVDRVLKLLAAYRRGDVCPWPAVERAAGFERQTPHWPAFVRRLKRDFMRATGVCLWPVYGRGWKLLTHTEQLTERSEKRQRRAGRQLHKDVQEIRAVPDAEISLNQMVGKARRLQIVRESLARVREGVRTSVALDKPSESGIPRVRPLS